jgi:hypothetical protein
MLRRPWLRRLKGLWQLLPRGTQRAESVEVRWGLMLLLIMVMLLLLRLTPRQWQLLLLLRRLV